MIGLDWSLGLLQLKLTLKNEEEVSIFQKVKNSLNPKIETRSKKKSQSRSGSQMSLKFNPGSNSD